MVSTNITSSFIIYYLLYLYVVYFMHVGLMNASLLENEMQVCCSSPAELKGVPVWQVPECKTITTPPPGTASLTTVSLIAVNLTTVSLTSANLTIAIAPTVITTKPLTIGHTTLSILIGRWN